MDLLTLVGGLLLLSQRNGGPPQPRPQPPLPGPPQPPAPPQPAPVQPQPPAPPPSPPQPSTPQWPTKPPPAIAALKFPDGWTAMSPLVPAVVTRANQLLNAGFGAGNRYPDPQSAPDSAQRLEFVGGHWVRFVPYYGTMSNGQMGNLVVAWVPKQGLDPSVDEEETEAPPPGAPPYAAQPGPVAPAQGGGSMFGVPLPNVVLGSTEANQLQTQVSALNDLVGRLFMANAYLAQAVLQLGANDYSAAQPFLIQAGQQLWGPNVSLQGWNMAGSPWLVEPQVTESALAASESIIHENVVSGVDLRELSPDEARAEGLISGPLSVTISHG